MMETTYVADVVAKQAGTTYGFHREVEAKSWADAYVAILADLRANGWNIVKVRRA